MRDDGSESKPPARNPAKPPDSNRGWEMPRVLEGLESVIEEEHRLNAERNKGKLPANVDWPES